MNNGKDSFKLSAIRNLKKQSCDGWEVSFELRKDGMAWKLSDIFEKGDSIETVRGKLSGLVSAIDEVIS